MSVHSAEARYEKFSEVDVEFVKTYWHRGNLKLLAEVLGRSYASLQSMTYSRGIKFNPGDPYYSFEQLKKIYDEANRKVNNKMVHVLPQEAVQSSNVGSSTKPTSHLKCPCLSEDTIIVRRIKLVNDGELWVCARCGRQIGVKRGDNI